MPSPGTKPLTRVLARSVPGGSRVKGRAYQLEGAVRKITGTPWTADATVKGSRAYAVDIHRDDRGHLTASCDCPYFTDRFVVCKHIWAALLEAERRGFLLGDGDLPEGATIEPVDRADASDPEYATRAETARRAGREKAKRPRPWEQFLEEFSRNLTEAESLPAAPRFADAQIVYVIDRAATIGGETLALDLQSRQRKKNGEWGRPKPAPVGSADLGQLPDAVDRQIVPLLLGATDPQIAGHFYMSQFARASFRLAAPLVERVLPLVAQSGRAFLRVQPSPGEQLVQLAWDDGPAWTFRLEIVHASGDEGFSIDGALIRGSERLAVRAPWLVLGSGYIIHGNRIARLDPRGAFAWLSQLRGSGPMVIPPGATGQLLDVLARSGVDPSDLPDELQFEIVNESPRPSVSVRADTRVTPASPAANLHATVTFDYGGHIVEPGSGATTFDSVRRLLIRRDLQGEQAALNRLAQAGFWRQWDYESARQHFAITTARFPAAVRELVAEGWRVEAEGRTFRSVESMKSDVRSGIDWFELHGSVDFGGGQVVALPRLLEAFRHGRATVTLDDGTTGIVPEEWLRSWAGIAGVGEAAGDHVRFKLSQVALLDAVLAAQPAVRVDERFARVRDELSSFSGITAARRRAVVRRPAARLPARRARLVRLPARVRVRRLPGRRHGARQDRQVLALLDRLRASERESAAPVARGRAALAGLQLDRGGRALRAGAARARLHRRGRASVDRLDRYDLVLTTYGTLRRDALILKDVEFDYAILDEAQAIKNADDRGGEGGAAAPGAAPAGAERHADREPPRRAVEPVRVPQSRAARHRRRPSRGIAAPPRRRIAARSTCLSRGIRPFILRRTKAQVAPELPAEDRADDALRAARAAAASSTTSCAITTARRCSARIARDGLQRSKMHVLEALLRLRQAACHPGLIDPRRADEPSAKLDVLLPQLARGARGRAQGAGLLAVHQPPRAAARRASTRTGSPTSISTARPAIGRRRSTASRPIRECRLFLISLKAGGLGLNLTAAEYVFLLDPWWNPAVEAQAIDRAHRIGQTRHVFAYRLIATGHGRGEDRRAAAAASAISPTRSCRRTRGCCETSNRKIWRSCCRDPPADGRNPSGGLS